MARPKDADSERTIEAILCGALAVMAETGSVQAPSLRVVAARAGVSLGTLRYYFETKEELLEACLDGYYERLSAVGMEVVGLASTIEDSTSMIEAAVGKLYDFCYRERALLALRMSTNAARGQLHPRRQSEFMGGLIQQAAKAMLPHVHVDEQDARMSVQAVASIIVRFVLMSDSELQVLTDREGDDARERARAFTIRAALRLVRLG